MLKLANEHSVEVVTYLYNKVNKEGECDSGPRLTPADMLQLKNEVSLESVPACTYAQEAEAFKILLKLKTGKPCPLDLNFLLQMKSSKSDVKYGWDEALKEMKRCDMFKFKTPNIAEMMKALTSFRSTKEAIDVINYLMIQHQLHTQEFVVPYYSGVEQN